MIKKIILTIKTIKNLNILFLDFFGLLHGEITYKLWNGILMNARAGSTDFAEIIIINGDLEYPSRFFHKTKILLF